MLTYEQWLQASNDEKTAMIQQMWSDTSIGQSTKLCLDRCLKIATPHTVQQQNVVLASAIDMTVITDAAHWLSKAGWNAVSHDNTPHAQNVSSSRYSVMLNKT